jgi:hypothetical protein
VSTALAVFGPLGMLYLAFLWWYGGRGRPLTDDEREQWLQQLGALARSNGQLADPAQLLASVRDLVLNDDGREFVMQNLVRYRPKALYPPGYDLGDDARAADRRYGRAIVPHLLACGSLPVFIARRSGRFIEPEGADDWHYVAMVRYRSRRDFLRFAWRIEQQDVAVHKWAAIEKTHVFPVQPLVSLVFVRGAVAVVLLALGLALLALVG